MVVERVGDCYKLITGFTTLIKARRDNWSSVNVFLQEDIGEDRPYFDADWQMRIDAKEAMLGGNVFEIEHD